MSAISNTPLRFTSGRPIRHLIALIDGSWVSASRTPGIDRLSNLYKLTLFFDVHGESRESQMVLYFPGIGSQSNETDAIVAAALARDVERVYMNICSNYFFSRVTEDRHDKIYIFGFSRGAVVARIISSLISRYGLLKPDLIQYFQVIWDDFIGTSKIDDLIYFKNMYCIEKQVDIEFLGLFDTVYGFFFGADSKKLQKIFFADRVLSPSVRVAVHLLALHETRAAFKPVLFSKKSHGKQILQQIWMPGVHSDVGGGYVEDYMSNVALATMIDRIIAFTKLKILNDAAYQLGEAIANDRRTGRLVINNEYENYIFKIQRLFKRGNRRKENDEDQFIHSVCVNLRDARVFWKDRGWRFFEPPAWGLETAEFDPSIHGDGR
jgi:uncharacterized protein (DUF2235 family)